MVNRGDGMACRQRDELIAVTGEQRIGVDDECAGLLLDKGSEGRLEVAFATGIEYQQFHPEQARCALSFFCVRFSGRSGWIDEKGDRGGCGHQLAQQLQPFCDHCGDQKAYAGKIAAGLVEAGDKAEAHRVTARRKHDWNCRRGRLGRQRGGQATCGDHAHLTASQISRHRRQSIVFIGPAVFEGYVLSFDIAGFI
jgi:hypothetical protein